MEIPGTFDETTEVIERKKELAFWQNRMLPTMKKLVLGLTFFFFIATLAQLIYLDYTIRSFPKLDLQPVLQNFMVTEGDSFKERKDIVELKALILLEANTFERRHHHSNIVLIASIWVRYLAFVTGMILAFIGAIFILGKLEESSSIIGAAIPSADFTIKSSSPGIILVVLGSFLILSTIIMQHTVNVSDASVYLGTGNAATTGSTTTPLLDYDADSIK